MFISITINACTNACMCILVLRFSRYVAIDTNKAACASNEHDDQNDN